MNRSFLVTFLVAFLPFNLIGAEPSAFGAGNLNSSKPYGLTSSEEVVLQNKKNLQKVVANSNDQADRVDSIRERIDGLQTIIEGLSRKSQENKINLQKLDEKNTQELDNSNEYEKRVSEVTQSNTQISQVNSQNIEDIKLVISELSLLVDNIQKTYVTKDEYNSLVKDLNKFKDLVAKELKKSSSPKKSGLKAKSNAQIAKEARSYYDKKYYTKSIERYSYLIEKNYKPANAHYMIGEMKYRRKNYAEAIAYYKKSASLYSKAKYMPILMLHTARAMELTGDKKNAKSFYNGVIVKYPNSSQAKDVKKYLNSMK
ncbi:MAG: tetratricopeptide repeat protein [Campylobacterota bacterium]|nr:tetratricopeptide repeat protein [Campylobacterota bacterium]